MELKGSVPGSQEPTMCSYPEPDESIQYIDIPYLQDLF
jgi:hypothetical protein